MPRLFIAIDLPETLRRHLTDHRTEIPNVRWVARDNLHVTLRFLGDVSVELVPELVEGLNQIDAGCFELEIREVALFPNERRPRILALDVAPVTTASDELLVLHADVSATLKKHMGLQMESWRFRPHVTLARMEDLRPGDARQAATAARSILLDCPRRFSVNSFVLYESRLGPGGPEYRPIRAFTLRDEPSDLAG
jgi:RNA 2',3'-cyclic 3'-phosphodiesterase